MKKPIYLDNQSTTQVDPRVLKAMLPYLKSEFGNPASTSHTFGTQAGKAVEESRAKIQKLIGAEEAADIIFTSGATESNNLAIRGVAELYRDKGSHIITTQIEHKSVLNTCEYLKAHGFQITYLPVDETGLIRVSDLKRAIRKETILISVIYAHNEIGVVQPIRQIGAIARAHNIFFHTDAAQALGKIPFHVGNSGLQLASVSAHKMYGPKGIGALYVRRKNPRTRLVPLLFGGGQEGGLRSGTLNVPAIVGFGKAAEISKKILNSESKRILKLRERLRIGLSSKLDEVYVNGSLEHRLSGNLNVSFAFVEGGSLLDALSKKVAVSTGSACASSGTEPSYTLRALGVSEASIHTSIRFGLGRFNTEKEIDDTIRYMVQVVKKLRRESAVYERHLKDNIK